MRKTSSRSRKRLAHYREVLKSQGSIKCGICLQPITIIEELTVDHIRPRAWGGNSRLTNLQPAHESCNGQKGNQLLSWHTGYNRPNNQPTNKS